MQVFTENLPLEIVFLGDAPGQSDQTRIGDRVYKRGESYSDVPPEHYARGGFHAMSEIEDTLVYLKKQPKHGIVLGTAPCMWDDLERAPRGLDVICVNGAGFLYLEPIAMWCSIHGSYMRGWIEKRRAAGASMDFLAYGNFSKHEDPGEVIPWNRPNGGGSSGMYAVTVALESGYDKVILCGVPLEGQQRYDYKESAEVVPSPTDYKHYRSGWINNREMFAGRVRSMSGWTRELLGAPTEEWLNS